MPQDVLHVLIHCEYPGVKKKRESFMTQYSKCARSYPEQSETVHSRELLNMDPQCLEDDKPLAQNIICSFVMCMGFLKVHIWHAEIEKFHLIQTYL